MFESYAVAVTLRLNNLVSPQIALMAREFAQLEKQAAAINASFKRMAEAGAAMGATARSFDGAAAAARSTAAAADQSAAAFNRATGAAARYRSELATMHSAAAMAARTPVLLPPAMASSYPRGALVAAGGGGMGGGVPPILTAPRLPAPGGMPYTPFTMRNSGGAGAVPPGGGGGAGGGGGGGLGGAGAGAVGYGLGAAGMGPLVGVAAAAWTISSLYQAGREYETALTRFKTLNLGDTVNKQAHEFARGTRVFGVSSTQLMETLRESVGMFGSMPTALKMAPVIAQLNSANSGLFGGKIGAIDEGSARSLLRFNDMRGLTDSPQDFMRGLNLAQRMVTGSGGALQFRDLEQLAKRGGAAFKGLSDEGVMMLSTLAQEQGGATTGTALMSMYQNLIAGRTTKKTMAALQDAGLVTLGQVTSGTVGGKKSTSTVITGIKDEKMLRENPAQWLMTYGTEAAKKSGANSESEVISFMNKLLSNRTGSNLAANFTTQQAQAMRDFTLTKNAMGADQTISAYQKTTSGKQAEFVAAWSNFKTDFSDNILPGVTRVLVVGAGFLRGLTEFMGSPGVKRFMEFGKNEMSWIGGAANKIADTVFREKPGAPEVRTGAAVPGNETAGGAFTGYRSPIRTGAANRMVQVETTVNLDGRAVGKAVTQHQAKELGRPQTGPRTADGRQSLRAFDLATGG